MAGNHIFSLKIYTLLLKLMKEITKITTQTMKKKEKTCLKDIILKPLSAIQMILGLKFINLLGEINSHVTKLFEEKQ